MNFTVTVLRLLIGSLFFGHGTQKLLGWFGGQGLKKTAGGFHSMGLRPGRAAATVAGVGETAGGAWLAAGLVTPLAAAAITGVMSQAIRTVHGPKGPWVTNGGWEYNAVLIATVTGIVEHGPGPASLDHVLGLKLRGPLWAAVSLAAGLTAPMATQRLLATFDHDDVEC